MFSYTFAPVVLAVVMAGSLAAQEPPVRPEPSLYRLRNAAAADVARAVAQFAETRKLAVGVVAEPVSNSVLVSGEPAALKQLDALITKIDAAPLQFRIEVTFLEVKPGFAEHVGIAAAGKGKEEAVWILTEREQRMLTAVGLREAKASGDLVNVFSRPTMLVANNQTGYAQVGSTRQVNLTSDGKNSTALNVTSECFSARVTPRVTPQGTILTVSFGVANAGSMIEMGGMVGGIIPDGGSSVWRGPKTNDGTEYLFIVKVNMVGK